MKRTSSGHFCPSLENLKAQKVCFYLFISYFSHKPFQLVTTFSYLVLHDLWLLVIFWLSHVLHFDHCYYSCPNFVKNRQFPKMLPLNCIWLIDYHVVQWFFFSNLLYRKYKKLKWTVCPCFRNRISKHIWFYFFFFPWLCNSIF